MYYSYLCSYCSKIFYTYHDLKEGAAKQLYEGIKKHLIEYNEDHKEYEFDEAPAIEIDQMYYTMSEHNEKPNGHYEV